MIYINGGANSCSIRCFLDLKPDSIGRLNGQETDGEAADSRGSSNSSISCSATSATKVVAGLSCEEISARVSHQERHFFPHFARFSKVLLLLHGFSCVCPFYVQYWLLVKEN